MRTSFLASSIGGLLLVLIASIMQGTTLFTFLGISPNLALIALLTLSFFISERLVYFVLVLVAASFLYFAPGFEFASLSLAIVALVGFFVRGIFPGRAFFNNLALIGIGTFMFYLILDASFVFADPITILLEMVYNIIWGIVIFTIAHQFLRYEKKITTTI